MGTSPRIRVRPPIRAVCEGQSFLLVGDEEYRSESGWKALGIGCLAWLAIQIVGFAVGMGLQAVLAPGVVDLVMALAPVLIVVPIVLAFIVWRAVSAWWQTAELEVGATGLTHGEWTLPWSRVQRVASDVVGFAQVPGTQPVVVLVESEDVAWAFPVRSYARAEQYAEMLRTWAPQIEPAEPASTRRPNRQEER